MSEKMRCARCGKRFKQTNKKQVFCADCLAKERLAFFQAQMREAETLDDEREIPQVKSGGRFVRGRYGRSGVALENALPPLTF